MSNGTPGPDSSVSGPSGLLAGRGEIIPQTASPGGRRASSSNPVGRPNRLDRTVVSTTSQPAARRTRPTTRAVAKPPASAESPPPVSAGRQRRPRLPEQEIEALAQLLADPPRLGDQAEVESGPFGRRRRDPPWPQDPGHLPQRTPLVGCNSK